MQRLPTRCLLKVLINIPFKNPSDFLPFLFNSVCTTPPPLHWACPLKHAHISLGAKLLSVSKCSGGWCMYFPPFDGVATGRGACHTILSPFPLFFLGSKVCHAPTPAVIWYYATSPQQPFCVRACPPGSHFVTDIPSTFSKFQVCLLAQKD